MRCVFSCRDSREIHEKERAVKSSGYEAPMHTPAFLPIDKNRLRWEKNGQILLVDKRTSFMHNHAYFMHKYA